MSQKPYFPPLYGNVECEKCEIKTTCWCCGKYQRNRRDFTHTSGRCPRLPDRRGFVEKSERELYAATFLLVHAERGEAVSYTHLDVYKRQADEQLLERFFVGKIVSELKTQLATMFELEKIKILKKDKSNLPEFEYIEEVLKSGIDVKIKKEDERTEVNLTQKDLSLIHI